MPCGEPPRHSRSKLHYGGGRGEVPGPNGFRSSRRFPMSIVGGLDLHRRQLTYDYLCVETGEIERGRIAPGDREHLRAWLARFAGEEDVEFAVEGCTGWRYVVEELARAEIEAHLADPAELSARKGPKRRAKTDRVDARQLRELLRER